MSGKRVFVGLSGGVDSSVAALRLQQRGFDVVGVFIKVWQPDFIDCNWEADRLDAMRVAAHLGIPFLTCDAEEAYKQNVADYFISEYEAGRTPNPDVLCNSAVKFGAFYNFAMERGADFVATGHYAQIERNSESTAILRGVDSGKDQSYFLWQISPEKLANIIFPIGDSPKQQIRKEAELAKIPVALKKDSQGVCFLGHIDIPEFLSHFIDLTPGAVLDTTGQIIGTHNGVQVYTLGQRHGFAIHTAKTNETAHYIIDRDIDNNTITVSTTAPIDSRNDNISLDATNLFTDTLPVSLELQFRYQQKSLRASILNQSETTIELQIEDQHERPSAGQSCVLYDGDRMLGGGIIA